MPSIYINLCRSLVLFCLGVSVLHAYGPIEQGKSVYIYKDCRSCHGDEGEGSREKQAPRIAGQSSWYVKAQLRKFQKGTRGAHSEDVAGKIMAPVSQTLSDEDVTNVAAYVASLDSETTSHALNGGDVAAGRKLYQSCILCHGNRGQGKPMVMAPKLSGLNDWYIVAQLENFKSGVRGSATSDHDGARMRPFAQALPDTQAMEDLAAYIKTFK